MSIRKWFFLMKASLRFCVCFKMVSFSRMFKYVPRSVRPLVQLEKNIVTRNLSASSFSSYHVSNIHSNRNKLSLSRSVFNTKEVSILSHRVFSTDLEEIDQEDNLFLLLWMFE